MFISKAKKEKIFEEIEILKVQESSANKKLSTQMDHIIRLTVNVRNLEKRIAELEKKPSEPEQPKANNRSALWTPELRARQSENMKKRWLKERIKKAEEKAVVGVPV